MDRRFITVLGASLLFALLVSTVFYQMTTNRGSGPKSAEATNMTDIVVAKRPLGPGSTIKLDDVQTIKVSKEQFPKGAFVKVEEVLDRPIIKDILQDEPVIDGRLAPRGAGTGLAPIIPVGMRAVSVRVTDVSAVAGFVLPGMRVDVLVTGRPQNARDTITTTVLQNVQVLSTGTSLQADPRGQAIQAPTVTLLVDPKNAEILTLANNEGRIQLVLRNGSDQNSESTQGVNVSQLYSKAGSKAFQGNSMNGNDDQAWRPVPKVVYREPAPRPVVATPVAAPPPPPMPEQIVVIRGDKRTVETIKPAAPAAPANPGPGDAN